MPKTNPVEVTRLLQAINDGDPRAADQLLPMVYQELRDLARARMSREKPGQTLTPTGLVHEAYLRLVQNPDLEWNSRGHFFGAAAEAMRRILVEVARRKSRVRHGGGLRRENLTGQELGFEEPEELLALDESLSRLETRDSAMANVVKLHFFAGLSVAETAQALEISERTVSRLWRRARAWLRTDIQSRTDPD
ncbi:MAG: ECF-type sigma factor [Xanthomonadales bacterium]|nr:ECF-type sigma factor [Xanthomonadales bacterium]